jgi:putative lipoic acid-binding regulatory protein
MIGDTQLIKFPCEFAIKVIGKNNTDFESAVLMTLQKNNINLQENAITERKSARKKYLAITVNIDVQSKQQLDDIYIALNACEQVIMTL